MKLTKYIKKTVNIKTNSSRHAVFGEIITDKERYSPYFVLCSYFEPQLLEKYGTESDEILHHGTGYVDCLDKYGQIHRLQYYEYTIIINGKRIASNFRKKFPQLNDKDGFKYTVGHFIEAADKNIEVWK